MGNQKKAISCSFCGKAMNIVKSTEGDGGITYHFEMGNGIAVAVTAAAPGKSPSTGCAACLISKAREDKVKSGT